jgi:hypothetical protein
MTHTAMPEYRDLVVAASDFPSAPWLCFYINAINTGSFFPVLFSCNSAANSKAYAQAFLYHRDLHW